MARLRAARANRIFCTDEKHIRTENMVIVITRHCVGVLHKIVDRARLCFSSVRNRRSARTVSRPRNVAVLQQRKPDLRQHVQNPGCSADLQGLSAYQNIQGEWTADSVDSRTRLG
jgi:hypothetical protein